MFGKQRILGKDAPAFVKLEGSFALVARFAELGW